MIRDAHDRLVLVKRVFGLSKKNVFLHVCRSFFLSIYIYLVFVHGAFNGKVWVAVVSPHVSVYDVCAHERVNEILR